MSDKKLKLIISKGTKFEPLLRNSIEHFGGIKSVIKEDDKVFIKIDLAFPEGYPSIFNPLLVKNLINLCLSASPKKIYIGGISSRGISAEFIWKSFGFADYFENQVVDFVSLDSPLTEMTQIQINANRLEFPKIISDSDVYIAIINPRLNPVFDMELSIYNSVNVSFFSDSFYEFENDEDLDHFDPNEILSQKGTGLFEYFLARKPDLVIIDFNHINSTPGVQFFSDSYSIDPKTTIISDDGALADYITLEMCGFDARKNPIIKTVENLKGKIINSDQIDKIILIDQNTSESNKIEEINFTKAYLKYSKDSKNSNEISLSDISEREREFPIIKNIPIIPEENELFPSKVEICKGKTCFGCKNAAYDLLYFLKSMFLKDIENLDRFSILLGLNPPEPDSKKNVIIFGNCAIKTTKNSDFRQISVKKSIKSEEDYNIELVRYEADIRNKILEWERKKANILENIDLETMDEEQKLNAIASVEKRDRKINNKMTKKLNRFKEKQKKSMERLHQRNKLEESKPNDLILEISGCPPYLLLYMDDLRKIFNKKWFPTFNIFSTYTRNILTKGFFS